MSARTLPQARFSRAVWICIAFVTCLVSATSLAAVREDKVRAVVHCLVEEGRIPGAVVLIGTRSGHVDTIIEGYRDAKAHHPMTRDTIFRLYSMTKPLTSVAVMMLAEQGKLKISDPVSKYIPEFRDTRVYVSGPVEAMVTAPVNRPITIADLLTHMSGITYHFAGTTPVHQYYRKYGVKRDTPIGSLPTDGAPATSLRELVQRIAKAPLLHQPGERFSYSNSTTVLGYVVERASGESLERFLQRRLLEPLGMTDTAFVLSLAQSRRLANNYAWNGHALVQIEDATTTDYVKSDRLRDGGGALAGSASDYMRFARMLSNGGELDGKPYLTRESVEQMFVNRLPPNSHFPPTAAEDFEFGYGFRIGNESTARAGTAPAYAVGWEGSGNTFFWIDRQTDGPILVFMTQVIAANGQPAPLRELIYDALYSPPNAPQGVCAHRQ